MPANDPARPDFLPGNENKEKQEEGNFYYMACALHAGSLIIVILLVEQPTVILCFSGSAVALFDRDNLGDNSWNVCACPLPWPGGTDT